MTATPLIVGLMKHCGAARRLDEHIVRTIATSTSGLLAQLRLLSAFFDESTNGAGRRGTLLIQSIAAGIERLDAGDPVTSSGTTMNAVDRSYSTHREIDGDISCRASSSKPRNSSLAKCHCLHGRQGARSISTATYRRVGHWSLMASVN